MMIPECDRDSHNSSISNLILRYVVKPRMSQKRYRKMQYLKPDVWIVDLSDEGSDGIELIRNLHSRNAQLPLLVLSQGTTNLYVERALKRQAHGAHHERGRHDQVLSGLPLGAVGARFDVSHRAERENRPVVRRRSGRF